MLRFVIWLAVIVLGTGPSNAQVPDVSHVATQAGETILEQGVLGAVAIMVAIAWSIVTVVLWKEITKRDTAIAGRDAVILDLQNKRAADGMTYARMLAEKTAESAASVQALTNQLSAWADRVQGLAELMRPVLPELARIMAGLDRNSDKIDRISGGR